MILQDEDMSQPMNTEDTQVEKNVIKWHLSFSYEIISSKANRP